MSWEKETSVQSGPHEESDSPSRSDEQVITGSAGGSEIYSARNIFGPDPAEFEEGPPRHSDPATTDFNEHIAEAQRLEAEIEAIEAETNERCEPLVKEQLLRTFRAWTLVEVGLVPLDVVENFIMEAGVKHHGNETIPCSAFMRAIVGESEAKDTVRFTRKRGRASTYAGAVDCAIHEGMTEEEFRDELYHPPTPGERHGIERLAERGRKIRREARASASSQEATASDDPPTELPFCITGDLNGIAAGYHLMVVKVEENMAKGTFLNLSEKLISRVLADHNKSHYRQDNSG